MALKMPANLVFIKTSDAEIFMVKALRMNNSEEVFGDDDDWLMWRSSFQEKHATYREGKELGGGRWKKNIEYSLILQTRPM